MSNFYTAQQATFRLSPSNSSFITQLVASTRGRDITTTIALAMAACAMTSLPGGEVESPETYFLENAGVNAAEAISVINEMVPVDYRNALNIAARLYLYRYETAVKPFQSFGYVRSEGIGSVFGLNTHIPKDVLDVIQSNAQEITDKYTRFMDIINDLKKA